ncbi:MAG TPA: NUDIX hydrolase [Burkholderiales bacterium]|nr:NUDIX hydrolase [Burkholderiales bacterium]
MSAGGYGGDAPPVPGVWRPSVTVAAILERDGRFLFVEEEQDGRRVLNQPAGHLDPGESLVHACAREVMEETAHVFAPEGLVGIYRWRYAAKDVTFLRFCFFGDILGVEEGRKLDSEIVALHWLNIQELKRRSAQHRSPLVQQCVDDYLAGRRFPLEVLSKAYG